VQGAQDQLDGAIVVRRHLDRQPNPRLFELNITLGAYFAFKM
jgi:hypothetical protein